MIHSKKYKSGKHDKDTGLFIPDVMSKYCEQKADTTMVSFRLSKEKLNHLITLINDAINPLLEDRNLKPVTVSSVLQILLYDEIHKLGAHFDEINNR
jgi:hypothetical protein